LFLAPIPSPSGVGTGDVIVFPSKVDFTIYEPQDRLAIWTGQDEDLQFLRLSKSRHPVKALAFLRLFPHAQND
jgi:hypothetical protein